MNKLIACLIIITASSAAASTITLDMDSLPSTQGWNYEVLRQSGVIESDIVAVDGSMLSMDTMGLPLNTGVLYVQYDVISPSLPASLEWTSRTLESEGTYDFGFCAGFTVGSRQYAAGISLDRISLLDNGSRHYIYWDASEYHTYRIEKPAGMTTYNFYIDGELQTSVTSTSVSKPNRLFFGDGTSAGKARVDLTSLEFTQIPEPASLGLITLMSGGIYFVRRFFAA